MKETGERISLSEKYQVEWKNLLDYENPQLALYKKLDAKQKEIMTSFSGSSAAWFWDRLKREGSSKGKYIHSKVKDGILLDIGGHHGTMKEAAENLDARLYVSIDPNMFYSREKLNPYKDVSSEVGIEQAQNTHTLLINDFALDVLARMKTHSIDGIVVNGIDAEIINDPVYLKAMSNEILRVIKSKGVIFGANSLPLQYISKAHVKVIESLQQDIYILEAK